MELKFAGIDFGARFAGTTAITYFEEGKLITIQSEKGWDTDVWLRNFIASYQFQLLYIDAPLSLPKAYYEEGSDFNYRRADRDLNAMSPMFLGGLTARAMSFNHFVKQSGIKCKEVYPAGYVRSVDILKDLYNKKDQSSLINVLQFLNQILPFSLYADPINYHQLDSLICWWIGYRHLSDAAIPYGDLSEGLIWI